MDSSQISELINTLLKSGEILATQIYIVAVRQIYVQAVLNILATIILVIGLFVSQWSVRKGNAMRKINQGSDWEYFLVIGWAGTVTCLAFSICTIFDAVSYLANPQWYAIKLLLDTLVK